MQLAARMVVTKAEVLVYVWAAMKVEKKDAVQADQLAVERDS